MTVRDEAGNTAEATANWTVDLEAPMLTVIARPMSVTNATAASFTVSAINPEIEAFSFGIPQVGCSPHAIPLMELVVMRTYRSTHRTALPPRYKVSAKSWEARSTLARATVAKSCAILSSF